MNIRVMPERGSLVAADSRPPWLTWP